MRFFLLVRTLLVWALLAGAAAFFAHRTYELWLSDDPVAGGAPEAARPAAVPRVPRSTSYGRPAPLASYDVIPQRSLFSEDRSEGLPEDPMAPVIVLPPRPLDTRFALFGVVTEGGRRRALVANLEKRSTADPDEVWVEAGDVLGTLTVLEIGASQIVLSDGTTEHVVRLSERSPWKPQGGARPAPGGGGVKRIEVGAPGEKGIRPKGAATPGAGAPQQK